MNAVRFCNHCGSKVEYRIPPGDHLPRHACGHCGHIQYFNPHVIVGCIPEAADGRILMCRRAIEPRCGLWTFPAGFMELGESTAEGAARETHEEAQAEVDITGLVAVFDVVYISQVYFVYRGRLRHLHHGPTAESSETRLMHERELPWDEIAFTTVRKGLELFLADRASGLQSIHQLTLREHQGR